MLHDTKAATRFAIRILWTIALGVILDSLAFGQFQSSVEGSVQDTTQAGVPGAEVTLVNESTQVTLRTTTNESGFFRLPQLSPGNYRVEVRKGGFKSWLQTNLRLEGSEIRTVYPVLAVGEQVTTVSVEAMMNAIETGTSKISRSVEEKTIAETPMVGRNIYGALAALAPGITGSGGLFGSGYALNQDSFVNEPGFQINAAGQRQEQNEFEVDGTSVNGNSRDGIANLTPEPDTVQEIRVSANTFSAEKGRNSGALVEVFTKSGTNQFHGTLSEFHSDNRLTSRTLFQSSIPASRRNEYGFTIGGPVVRNKTFVFGSYYGLKSSVASTSVVREETPEFRDYVASNFPNSIAARFLKVGAPLSYPTSQISTVAQVRTANPGSYPSDRFPSDLPVVGTATVNQTTSRPAMQWNTRVDQNLREYKDRVYFNWFRTTTEGQQASTRAFLRYVVPSYGAFGRLSWTHTFSPSLLNEFSASLVRAGGYTPPAPGGENLPIANISGISTGFSQGGYYRWQHNNIILHDGLTWMRGHHQIHTGVDIDRQRGYAIQSNNARPTFQFSNILDFAQDLPFSQSGPTIDIAKSDTALDLYRKLYVVYVGAYVQDDWKATKRLTINAGLRWDYFGHWATGHQGIIPFPIFTPGAGSAFQDQVASGAMKVRGAGYFTDNKPNGWAPRIGMAWDVFGNGSTSIRAAYGLFYSRVANLAYATNGSNTNPPAFGSPFLTVQQPGVRFGYGLGSPDGYYFAPPPGFSFQIDPRGGIIGTRVSIGGMDPNPVQPRTHDWTFSIQRRLGGSFVVEADYLGSHSAHLFTQTDVNRYAGDLVAHNGALVRLNPSFGPIVYGQTIGNSDANIFSFSLGRRFAHGWSAKAIYTTGRALDADSSNDNGVGGGRNILDAYNLQAQHGRADYDIKRRLTLDSVWELPSPFKSPALKNILGGWRLAGIAMFSSGRPFTVFTSSPYPSGDFNADGFNWDVPNAPAFGNSVSASRSDFVTGLFKVSDFPKPARGERGNLGRNTFEGPGLANVNLNVIKATRIPWFVGGEGATVELRGEIFNLLNRVNLTQPTSDLASGLFGRSTDQSLPRAVQLGLRIQF
jgi:hypothetical protein